MKVFITGHKGYIGAHLTALLKEEGHTVTACDIGYFNGCEWGPLVQPDKEIQGDVAAITERDLEGHDCVMHLAAISNDPMGDIDEALTYRTNRDASIDFFGATTFIIWLVGPLWLSLRVLAVLAPKRSSAGPQGVEGSRPHYREHVFSSR